MTGYKTRRVRKNMLQKQRYITYCLILLCSLWWGSSTAVVAQDSSPRPTPASTETETETTIIERTFADWGYTDLRMRGLYATGSMWFPFQSDWPITGDIELELVYTASPLLNMDEAILTVLANNLEVTSIRPVGDGLEQRLRVTIPASQRLAEGVTLNFNGYLRLTDNLCEDSFNTGQWLLIRDSSRVTINTAVSAPTPQLNDLPHAMVVQGPDDPAPLLFILPEDADEMTLTTAVQVAKRLGTQINANHLPLQVTTPNNLTERQKEQSNLILIGLAENNALIRELADDLPIPPTADGFVAQNGVLIPATDGVIQLFRSPWHHQRNILLVSGNEAAGLQMAGQAFEDESTFRSFQGRFYFVHRLVELPEPRQPRPWTTPLTTFAQLGQSDLTTMGLGLTDSNYYFPQPAGTLLDPSRQNQLLLHLAFSPALRAQTSYAILYVNDIYVGSVDAATTEGEAWVAFDLPTEALNERLLRGETRELKVQLSIANLLPTNSCEQIDIESSWTKVYADSHFDIGFVPTELPDLAAFPHPFVDFQGGDPVRIVVPARPTRSELSLAFSLAAVLGQQNIGDMAVDIRLATPDTSHIYPNYQLITLGTPDRHPLLHQLIDDTLLTAPPDIYQLLSTSRNGFFQTMHPVWDEEQVILAIFGETPQAFNIAADAFYEQGYLVRETGSLALIRPGHSPVVVYREAGVFRPIITRPDLIAAETTPEPEPTILPEPQAPPEPDEIREVVSLTNTEWLILVSTTFLVILVSIAALIRIAWRIRA